MAAKNSDRYHTFTRAEFVAVVVAVVVTRKGGGEFS